MILRGYEVEPLVNVVAFEETVGGERAVVGAGVGQEYGESVSEQELRVSSHADAVITEAVEQEDGVAVGVMGMDHPGAQDDVVGGGDGGIGEFGVKGGGGLAHRIGFGFGGRAAGGAERAVGEVNAARAAEG